MLKKDVINNQPRKDKLLGDVDLVVELDDDNIDETHFMEIIEELINENDPSGPTKVYETMKMEEALDVANALTWFFGEAEIQKNDETGLIKVFSYGNGKGRIKNVLDEGKNS